jgi:radical SAM protein with 4Fe4S-binding SPASM domain
MLYYYIRIARTLSFRKVGNMLLLYISFHLSRLLKRPVVLGKPAVASIEPSTSCNLRCPQCPSGLRRFSRPTGMLDLQLYKRMLQELGPQLHSLTLYFQGEPFLHPNFTDLVKEAKTFNIFTITSTNAHYLTDELASETIKSGLDKLIISVDGTTAETYRKYRVGGDFEKVLEGTRRLVEQKKLAKAHHPHIVWQFVVFKHNEHQIEDIKRLGKDLQVDEVSIKTAQVYDFEEAHQIIPSTSKYARYKLNGAGKFEIKNKLLNQCWRMWQGCVITWDGKIVPCCFDKDAKHSVGELNQQSFAEIWKSPNYNAFRQAVLIGRKEIDICANCSEGSNVFE